MLLPPLPVPSRVHLSRVLLAAFVFSFAGCGGPDEPAPPRPAAPPARPRIAMPTPEQQAQFALDRLLTGPVPQSALLMGSEQHDQVLRMAARDLAYLPSEALALLSDPALLTRVAGPEVHPENLNPWDNVLGALLQIPDKSAALVCAWTRPVLARHVPALTYKAIQNLSQVEGPEVSELLLAFLKKTEERETGRTAWSAVARQPAPWPARALEHVRRRGSPDLWVEVVPRLEQRLSEGKSQAEDENLLAWWALLTEPGGPRGFVGLPRLKEVPWSNLSRVFSTRGPRALPGDDPERRGAGPWPEADGLALRWLSIAPEDSSVRTVNELLVTGAEPAADARCALARREVPAYRASVAADRASPMSFVVEKARHCLMPLVTVAAGADAAEFWEAALTAIKRRREGDGAEPKLAEVQALVDRVPAPSDEEKRGLIARILREVRPLRTYQLLLERAYDALASAQLGLEEEFLRGRLADPDPGERGLALHLIQRGRVAALLPDVERLLTATAPQDVSALRRILTWVHAGGRTEPRELAAFARRYAGWVEEADDERAVGLATGLLDLGAPGAAEFVAGLKGRRFGVFLAAVAGFTGVVPVEVAEALADRVDAATRPDLRHAALVALWRAAPAQAAPAIAGMKSRLDPTDHAAVDVVVRMVSHRAAQR